MVILRTWPVCLALAYGCASCGQGTDRDASDVLDGDADADVLVDPDLPDESDTLIDPDPDPDVPDDTHPTDPVMDEVADPDLVDCQELDYEATDLGTLELPVYDTVDRTPMECGDCCRQVSFTQGDLWSGAYDVWGDWLIMNTWFDQDIDHMFKRVILVSLTTLEHFIVDERNSKLADRPANGYVDLFLNRMVFQTGASPTPSTWDYELKVNTYTDPSTNMIGSSVFEYDYPVAYGGAMQSMDSWGDLVAWSDYRSPLPVIAVLDLETREECLVTGRGFGAGNPAVWNGKVVFHEGSMGWFNVFVYDSADGSVTRLTGPEGDQFGADIWQDKVVWTDTHGEGTMMDQFNSDVYMMDLSTGTRIAVCTNPAMQPAPVSIYGDRIAWVDCRDDPAHAEDCGHAERTEIYIHDIATGTETRLTDSPYKKHDPIVFENRVYFTMDDADGVLSIFEVTLPD